MNKTRRLLKFVLIPALIIIPAAAFADNADGVISRPVIEYSSGDLRDPFMDLFQMAAEKEKREKELRNFEAPKDETDKVLPMPSLDKIKVQGLIWGGRFPQAVINGRILGIGDSIESFKIVNIEKKGITLSFSGRTVNLPTPGNAPDLKKKNKEEK